MATTPTPPKPGLTGAWIVTFDGCCWPNPGGVMGAGWVVDADGETVTGNTSQRPQTRSSSNTAEWFACGFALLAAAKLTHRARPALLIVRGDSQLILNQLSGTWNCNVPLHASCRRRCLQLIETINPQTWRAEWVPREHNTQADELSRRAYREVTGREPPEMGRRSA